MASLIGSYSLNFALACSFLIIFFSIKNFNNQNIFDNKIITLNFFTIFLVTSKFFGALIISFVYSDFSNETVFNHSHTTQPLFYKISGSMGKP